MAGPAAGPLCSTRKAPRRVAIISANRRLRHLRHAGAELLLHRVVPHVDGALPRSVRLEPVGLVRYAGDALTSHVRDVRADQVADVSARHGLDDIQVEPQPGVLPQIVEVAADLDAALDRIPAGRQGDRVLGVEPLPELVELALVEEDGEPG